MASWLIILCYIFVAYGACNIMVFGSGPFKVFENWRRTANRINEHFGQMFSCMMCLPANFGWIASLLNWLLVSVGLTPFNILFSALPHTWPYCVLICLCDGAFTSGTVWLIHNIETLFENKSQETTTYINTEDNSVDAEDITL